MHAARNYRVWILFGAYAACFGIEIFIHNIIALYFVDNFQFGLKKQAWLPEFWFTGVVCPRLGWHCFRQSCDSKGLDGRTKVLFALIMLEGLFLILFSQMNSATLAIMAMTIFALFTHMACGATYALVPFIDRDALGGVAGIIGAGGNVGAVAAGFLLKGMLDIQTTLMVLGGLVVIAASCVLMIRFSVEHKEKNSVYMNRQ